MRSENQPTRAAAKVLLVDSRPAKLLELRNLLQETGYQLVEVRSGDEALHRMEEEDIAVMLLAVRMPGLDGFETARRMRGQERARPTPILFIADPPGDPSDMTTAYQIGAVDYLVMPLAPEMIRAKVAGLVFLFEEARQARRQAEQLRLLIDGTPEYAIFMLDPTGHIATWNPGAERIKGYKAEEIIGKHFSQFYPREDVESGKPPHELKVAIATGKYEEEGWRVRKDGTRFWASVVITALWEEGELRGFGKVTRDVTARKQAEENARRLLQEQTARTAAEASAAEARRAEEQERAQREQLRTTLESIGDAVIVTDAGGRVILLNPVAEALTGWIKPDAAGKPLEEVFHIVEEQTGGLAENPVARVLREKVVVGLSNHTVLIARDGARRPIDDSAAPIRNPAGQILGVVLVFRDIAQRKRAEQTAHFLAEASAALAAVVDYQSTLQKVARLAVPFFADWCAIDMLEADGTLRRLAVTHVDPSKVRLAHELHRRYPPDPQAPDGTWNIVRTGKAELVSEIPDALLTERVKDENLLAILRELGLKSYMGVPLLARGKVRGVITFIAAESDRRYSAEDLAVAEDLAHRATVAIENAELYRELREADRNKDEFLAMLAHELRNPLAPMRNALQILRMRGADVVTGERAREMMERQLQHLIRLVDDLLDISRIMRGKIELRMERLELETVIARAVETVQPLIDSNRHEFHLSMPREAVWVHADLVRLAQVVANLLNNSAKYTEPGGHLWLTVERAGAEVLVSVRDTGLGIAADMLPRIFDLFVQAEHGTGRAQGGLGIGLTLVRRLVEMHGGQVTAASEGPGKGSEFIIRLPALPLGKTAGGTDLNEGDAAPGGLTGRRILVVDDNGDAADSLAMLLRLEGQEVLVAYHGVAALEAAQTFRPEMVFLDIGMPGMDGFEVARRLRQQPGMERTSLIALTGWGQEEDRRRSRAAGFDHHMIKPADLDKLRELLSRP